MCQIMLHQERRPGWWDEAEVRKRPLGEPLSVSCSSKVSLISTGTQRQEHWIGGGQRPSESLVILSALELSGQGADSTALPSRDQSGLLPHSAQHRRKSADRDFLVTEIVRFRTCKHQWQPQGERRRSKHLRLGLARACLRDLSRIAQQPCGSHDLKVTSDGMGDRDAHEIGPS